MNTFCPYCKSINCESGKCSNILKTMMETQKKVRQPFFKGYEPNFYFKRVNPYRSDTRELYEPQPYRQEV